MLLTAFANSDKIATPALIQMPITFHVKLATIADMLDTTVRDVIANLNVSFESMCIVTIG